MVIEEALGDPRLRRAEAETARGGLAAACEHLAVNPTPGILVVESSAESEALLRGIEALSEVCDAHSNVKVIVVGARNDVALYRALIRRGVSEYLTPPLTAASLREALIEACAADGGASFGRVIAFFGAKGGVGSSTLACNLAWCLSQTFREDVAFLDLDVAFGTAGLAFNLDSQQDIQTVLGERARLDDMLIERVMPKYDPHLSLFTAPASLDAPAEIDIEAFETLLALVRRRSAFVVLDVPHVWSGWVRDVLALAGEVVVVAAPDLACLRATKSLVERLRAGRGDDEPVRVVLNKIGAGRRTELSAKSFHAVIGGPPDLVLPFDPALFGTAANNGEMLGETQKSHKAVAGIGRLAVALSGRRRDKPRRRKIPWIRGAAS